MFEGVAGVGELIDRAVGLPPGPQLSAALAGLSWEKVPNARLVEVVQAQARQLAHEQAGLLAGLAEIACAVPVCELPVADPDAVARASADFEWASHEIAAALTWTPTAADRELAFATTLVRELPLVFAALKDGRIDRHKAWVFVQQLDPARGELTEAQIRWLCELFVPLAAGLTTRQLAGRLLRAIVVIDPEHHQRRYRRAVRERGVALHLDRTGTATLSGEGLAPAEAAAAAARLDRLAAAAKRAGHPGRLGQISADLYVGMLDGSFHGLTEAQILARLLAHPRPEDQTEATGSDASADSADSDDVVEATDVREDTPGEAESVPGSASERWDGEIVGIREGTEVRVGLATLVGTDERPGEIPGLGPVAAAVARAAVAAQHRGAAWQFAIVDAGGHLLLAGPLRRRPRAPDRPASGPPGRVRGGVVELHLTVAELHRFAADPDALGGWAGVVAEIAARWAQRHHLRQRLAREPGARFARGALARHVQIRDRTCCGPGCTRPARRSDLDHTREHARGGATVEANIGPGCWRHHPDKDRGWTLTQPQPGHFVWISPLGRKYRTRGEPIRPDLPDPDPPPPGPDPPGDPGTDRRDTDHRDTDHGGHLELRILWRPSRNPLQPPPPADGVEDDEPSF